MTTHNACAWGLKVANGLPIRMLFQMLTSTPIQGTPCPHIASARHDHDHTYFNTRSTNTLTDLRSDNHTAMMGHLLQLAIGADLTTLTRTTRTHVTHTRLTPIPLTRTTRATDLAPCTSTSSTHTDIRRATRTKGLDIRRIPFLVPQTISRWT